MADKALNIIKTIIYKTQFVFFTHGTSSLPLLSIFIGSKRTIACNFIQYIKFWMKKNRKIIHLTAGTASHNLSLYTRVTC